MTESKPDKLCSRVREEAAARKASELLGGYSKGMQRVLHDKALITREGQKIFSLVELAYTLEGMDEKTFGSHVTESHNDFYVWVRDVIKDNILAERILADRNRGDMSVTVAERILECSGRNGAEPLEDKLVPHNSYLFGFIDPSPGRQSGLQCGSISEEKGLIYQLDMIIARCDIEEASKRHRMIFGIKSVLSRNPTEKVMGLIGFLDRMKSEDPAGYSMLTDMFLTSEFAANRRLHNFLLYIFRSTAGLSDLHKKIPELYQAAEQNPSCWGHGFIDEQGRYTNRFENQNIYYNSIYQSFCDQFRKITKQMLREKVNAARLASEDDRAKAKKEARKDTFIAVYSALVVPTGIFGFGALSTVLWAGYISSLPEKIAAFSIPAVAGGILVGSIPYLAKKAYGAVFGPDESSPEKIFKPRAGPVISAKQAEAIKGMGILERPRLYTPHFVRLDMYSGLGSDKQDSYANALAGKPKAASRTKHKIIAAVITGALAVAALGYASYHLLKNNFNQPASEPVKQESVYSPEKVYKNGELPPGGVLIGETKK